MFLAAALTLGVALATVAPQALFAAQQGNPQPKSPEQTGQQNNNNKEQQQVVSIPLPKGKKLFLKDGSFQVVREYERKSDRVRYYSVERSAWEEIPAELVDWEATRKAEADEVRRQQEIVERIRATQAAERTADLDVDASIEVVPGVFLPGGEGLFVVEGRAISPLTQVPANAKLDKGRLLEQVLVPIPVIPSRFKVQVSGKHAALRLTSPQPEFYMRTADAREPEMELIRAEVKGNARQIESVSRHITGQQTSKRKAITIQRWRVAKGVYRFTLSQPLAPGEYALAEILPEGMNLNVWDFGVDASASRPGSP